MLYALSMMCFANYSVSNKIFIITKKRREYNIFLSVPALYFLLLAASGSVGVLPVQGLFPLGGIQHCLANPDIFGRNLHQLILVNKLQGLLQAKVLR